MYRWFYQGLDLLQLPLFALVFFLGIFVGTAVWLFVARKGRDFDALAAMPFSEPGALSLEDTRSRP